MIGTWNNMRIMGSVSNGIGCYKAITVTPIVQEWGEVTLFPMGRQTAIHKRATTGKAFPLVMIGTDSIKRPTL